MHLPNIALYGKSGSGKSTVAAYLVTRHKYIHCSAGRICRQICRELFDSEDRAILNAFNDAVRRIDPMVWLRVAKKAINRGQPVVFDSMRFETDRLYFKALDFQLWRIDCPETKRRERLTLRGQIFEVTDELHPGEVELENSTFDRTFTNDSSNIEDLHKQIDAALSS